MLEFGVVGTGVFEPPLLAGELVVVVSGPVGRGEGISTLNGSLFIILEAAAAAEATAKLIAEILAAPEFCGLEAPGEKASNSASVGTFTVHFEVAMLDELAGLINRVENGFCTPEVLFDTGSSPHP